MHKKMHMIRYFLIVLATFSGLGINAQDKAAKNTRYLLTAPGLLLTAERDLAYSPLRYTGALPAGMIGYSNESSRKSEELWISFGAGKLSNAADALAQSYSAGIMNYTFYHKNKEAHTGWHWGLANNNHLNLRSFEDAGNYQPRSNYHTSFGPALRYRHQFEGKLGRFSMEALGHLQLIGFMLQSGYVIGAPKGFEDDSGIEAILNSASLFYPGKAWNWGLWPRLEYQLRSGNALCLSYRYEMAMLEDTYRWAQSSGYYLITLKTLL